MSYKHQFGKDGHFGIGEGKDAGVPRRKSKHVREQEARDNRDAHAFIRLANPARDNKPAPQPGRTFA